MGTAPATNLLTIAAPALLLIWAVSLIALAAWRRRIRSIPVAGPADIISKATRSRQYARAMIAWHTLGALVITAAFGLLSWPSALAALPLLILPALGIRKWARTAHTLTRILKAPGSSRRAQLAR
jgi:hypothetical protein